MSLKKIPFIAVNLLGLLAFALPFLIDLPGGETGFSARSQDAVWILAMATPLLIGVAVSEASDGALDSKKVALLGVLAGCAALLRLPVSFAGANLFFFLPMVAGFVFGGVFGFLLGALGMAASAAITGGFGPWLPFQMFAGGWVGLGAGLLKPIGDAAPGNKWSIAPLVVYASLAAFAYGALMNLYFWPVVGRQSSPISWDPAAGAAETLSRYANFYVITSAGWDAIGAIANVLMVVTLGGPVIALLRRYQRRFTTNVIEPTAPARVKKPAVDPAP